LLEKKVDATFHLRVFTAVQTTQYSQSQLIRATAGAILRIIYEHLPTCPYWQTLAENETLNDPDLLAQAIIKELEDEYNFSFDSSDDLGYDNESLPWYNPAIAGITYPYVFIDEDHSFDPNYNKTRIENLAYENNPIGLFSVFREKILLKARMYFIYELYKHNWSNCTGLILYDHNNDTYNMIYAAGMALPILFINKTDGEDMYNNAKLHYPLPSDDYTIDFYINQSWNESTVSYNVIGQINGTEQNKTVILCSYYDSWRNQGVVDGAVGMSVVLGIGRYMQQLKQTYNITPRFTVKFIAFCGEEVGYRGATYYAATHPNESIQAVIDLNQLGFDQKEPDKNLTLNIAYNVLPFRKTLQEILAPTNYKERTGNTVDFQERWMPLGGPANVKPFTTILLNDPHTFMFIKDTGWTRHHRDGLNHTEGDSMKYFNFTDTQLVTEAIYNFTKYWVYNPDCWFNGTIVTALSDIDSDGHDDTVTATIPIATLLPNDIVMVRGTLKRGIINYQIKREDYIITNENNVVNFSMTIPPSGNHHTDYQLKIELLNSTERIYDKTSLFQGPGSAGEANDTTTLDIHELHPRGNTNPNPPTLTGSADINTTEKYDLTINATDPERDKVSFKINWNSNSGFSFPLWNPETFESGENCT